MKVNTIQDNVYNACKEQVNDESKSNLLSVYHTQKYMDSKGFSISKQQVQSAFYRLTKKGLLKKDSSTIWLLNE
jgi:hypothetical protein